MFSSLTYCSTILGGVSRLSIARGVSSTASRLYADVVDAPKAASKPRYPKEGALRPHLNIKADPKHGLYGFFRAVEKNGKTTYETVEATLSEPLETGRSWKAEELRRKSFKDLHTLWYVLLRERNLLATQWEEGRRLGVTGNVIRSSTRMYVVRKSMARIKYVLNERRLAYEGAVRLHAENREKLLAQEAERKEARKRAKAQKAEAEKPKEVDESLPANVAAGGLLGDAQAETAQSAGSQPNSGSSSQA